MGTINDISPKLLSGSTVNQLIKEGYPKSTVNHATRKLKKTKPVAASSQSVNSELQELR